MTGQNYGQNRPGASTAHTTSQAVNSGRQWAIQNAQDARLELFELVDSFSAEAGFSGPIHELLIMAYEFIQIRARLDEEREIAPLNPVILNESDLASLYNIFNLIRFLSRLGDAYHKVLHLERKGGVEK